MTDASMKTCPYCHEKIQKKAKKCRFCGEWLEKKTQQTAESSKTYQPPGIRQLFRLWVSSIAIFYLILYAVNFNFSMESGYWAMFLLFDVMLGGVFFMALVAKLLGKLLSHDRKRYVFYYLGTILVFISFFAILYNMPSAQSGSDQSNESIKNTVKSKPKSTATPKSTSSPAAANNTTVTTSNTEKTITCIGPDGKQFDTTMDECTALNEKWGKPVDYMINCNIHQECGGGTKYMPKSECDKPCSGIKNDSANTGSTNSKADYLCINNVTGYTYYTTSGEKCNLDNAKAGCLDIYDTIYDSCMDRCLDTANDTSTFCIYNLSGTEKDECLEEKDKDHLSCMDECGAKYTKDSETCY